jgi:glycosyltransferase involved in cell wall biosynthesis
MLGLRTDVAEIMAASDILVHSSLREGLPKTVLEGMAAGKPVIGTNVGGVPAVVDDGETGLLVEPQDAGGMAAAMLRLLEDPALCQRLVTNGSERVQSFSLTKSIDDTNALYDALLGAKR